MDPANPAARPQKPGMGGQSHGSRKGLGGDPPNGPVKGARKDVPYAAPKRRDTPTEQGRGQAPPDAADDRGVNIPAESGDEPFRGGDQDIDTAGTEADASKTPT